MHNRIESWIAEAKQSKQLPRLEPRTSPMHLWLFEWRRRAFLRFKTSAEQAAWDHAFEQGWAAHLQVTNSFTPDEVRIHPIIVRKAAKLGLISADEQDSLLSALARWGKLPANAQESIRIALEQFAKIIAAAE